MRNTFCKQSMQQLKSHLQSLQCTTTEANCEEIIDLHKLRGEDMHVADSSESVCDAVYQDPQIS